MLQDSIAIDDGHRLGKICGNVVGPVRTDGRIVWRRNLVPRAIERQSLQEASIGIVGVDRVR